jgi:hypothetical protein
MRGNPGAGARSDWMIARINEVDGMDFGTERTCKLCRARLCVPGAKVGARKLMGRMEFRGAHFAGAHWKNGNPGAWARTLSGPDTGRHSRGRSGPD